MGKTNRGMALLLAFIMATSLLCACKHEHVWTEATCTTPKTCSACGETEGEPLGHSWKEATCEAPKTCSVCGETEGEPKGHTWQEATCEAAKTCILCGKTEGEALGHVSGQWITEKEATIASAGSRVIKCDRCGTVIDSQTIPREKIIYENGAFNFTRNEFVELIENAINSKYKIKDSGEIDPLGGRAYTVSQGSKLIAMLSFKENGEGQVTTVIVWGEAQKEMIFMAVTTFSVVCGYDDDLTAKSDYIFESLEKTSACALNGFTMRFKNEGGGYGSFTIVG